MDYEYEIGDIIVARNTHRKAGYIKGDTIKIKQKSIFSGDFIADNLTRPGIGDLGHAYLGGYFRGNKVKNSNLEIDSDKQRIYFLGLPLFTIKKVKSDD